VFREAEPSPEAVPHYIACDDTSAVDVAADTMTDAVPDHFQLPEPPDLSALMPSLPADADDQLSEYGHVDVDHSHVEESDTTVL